LYATLLPKEVDPRPSLTREAVVESEFVTKVNVGGAG